eukprot:8798915-Pyramimonas_sp.AAC.1
MRRPRRFLLTPWRPGWWRSAPHRSWLASGTLTRTSPRPAAMRRRSPRLGPRGVCRTTPNLRMKSLALFEHSM